MNLVERVERAMSEDGPFAKQLPNYRARGGQLHMACEVARTMESGGILVVEAGTGVGKTFAYVIPALLSGQKVILSTATKALQDQLFRRDIPLLLRTLTTGVRVAMLKGRSSYLCLHRMHNARLDPRCDAPQVLNDLSQVESWAPFTRSGDLAELGSLDDESAVIPLVTSTRENCLGSRCPQFSECHVNQARRAAMLADMVVVNHHLFFADLNVRESGVAELLPSVHAVVFDEAHQLNEIGVQFLGQQVSTGQLQTLCRELLRCTLEQARGLADWTALTEVLAQTCFTMRAAFSSVGKFAWDVSAPLGADAYRWRATLQDMLNALDAIHGALSTCNVHSPEMVAMTERVAAVRISWSTFQDVAPDGYSRWVECASSLRVVQAPLDIAQAMRTRVLVGASEGHSNKAWIFTSATLGHDPSLSWFVQSCGLQGATILQVESPFNYLQQASLYVPPHLPLPQEMHHSQAVADWVADAALRLGGRTLVLTTTLRAMRTVGEEIRARYAASETERPKVWVQGEAPKRELLARFSAASDHALGAVLVASASFWEGVDIPGVALQMVVIDKLPFSPPDDPWLQARARALEAQGLSPFKEIHLPQAAVMLKQGAGRLIRSETDCGILVVCDLRLVQKGYGKKLMKALPPMQMLQSQEAFDQALQTLAALTTASTKDLPWS